MPDQPHPQAHPVWQRMQALVDWERADRARMRVDVGPELDLVQRLGSPHRRLRTVHVTGTKGKGSVCALIEAGLLNAGLRAGRYASPHLEHVSERVSLMGRPIEDAALERALELALDARDAALTEGTPARSASWFDVFTAAALWVMVQQGLEWAAVEVGLGGRLDSTNVVDPDLAIVVNVDLEHTDVLGETVEAIATEKAGIIKRGKPVLTTCAAEERSGRVIRAAALERGAPLRWLDAAGYPTLHALNTAIARAALQWLGEAGVTSPRRQAPLGPADLSDDVAEAARLPGREETFDVRLPGPGATVRAVLDGAHVGFALSAVLRDLRADPRHAGPAVVVLALGADKNARDIVPRLAGVARGVICTVLGEDRRVWPPEALAALARKAGMAAECASTPLAAWQRCLEMVQSGEWILVTGSLYLVGELRGPVRRASLAHG
jgi:dihydrofolate synthase/folylpolyglutamate synthase